MDRQERMENKNKIKASGKERREYIDNLYMNKKLIKLNVGNKYLKSSLSQKKTKH